MVRLVRKGHFRCPWEDVMRKILLSIALMTLGAFLYAAGYGMVGLHAGLFYFALAISIVTIGEIFISPPSLALISGMAPRGSSAFS
jgi:dipeptide/tripeptide permease